MKKFFMFLCIVIMYCGIVGCPSSDVPANTVSESGFASKSVTTADIGPDSDPDLDGSHIPEPITLVLLGSGLVGLAVING